MKKVFVVLLFSVTYFQAQNAENNELLQKCSKEFDSKICLSDKDQDGTAFYLDHCPEVYGSQDNNGCPWPDSDGDGVLDKEDACPTLAGLPELNGCPSHKKDCTKIAERNRIRFEQFKTDYEHIDNIYSLINMQVIHDVINSVSKKELAGSQNYIYLKFIKTPIYCGTGNTCYDTFSEDSYNFLISKFWNRTAIEYILKKYQKDIVISTVFLPDLDHEYRTMMGSDLFDYLIQYIDPKTRKVTVPAKERSTLMNAIPIVVNFITPYKIELSHTKNTKVYEYRNNQWELQKK